MVVEGAEGRRKGGWERRGVENAESRKKERRREEEERGMKVEKEKG